MLLFPKVTRTTSAYSPSYRQGEESPFFLSFPVGFRRGDVGFLAPPVPAQGFTVVTSGLPAFAGPGRGFPVPHLSVTSREDAPYAPRPVVIHLRAPHTLGPPGGVAPPGLALPITCRAGLTSRGSIQGFTRIRPSALSGVPPGQRSGLAWNAPVDAADCFSPPVAGRLRSTLDQPRSQD